MKSYYIHLRNLDDFRNYANMMDRFSVAGYVEDKNYQMNMYRLLDIMSDRHSPDMKLVLTGYREGEVSALEKYLEETGLMNQSVEKSGNLERIA